MEKRGLFVLLVAALSLQASPQRVETENITAVAPDGKAAAREVVLTGRLTTRGNSDLRQLRDLCFRMERLDMGAASCPHVPENALHSRHRLKEVVLPRDVKSIGRQAFFACDSLLTLTLPASLDTVGESAFARCGRLERLVVEGSPRMGAFAFSGCGALREVEVRSAVPPPVAPTAFEGVDRRKCRLSVPRGAERLYRTAPGWRLFYEDEKQPFRLCRPADCLVPAVEVLETDFAAVPLTVKRPWRIEAAAGLENEARQARRLLDARGTGRGAGREVWLRLRLDAALNGEEEYVLTVTQEGVDIAGATAAGVFYGLMTLDQLLRADGASLCCDALPALRIADAPRTRVRELMVDPARIFIPFEELKAFVPEMARYKLNALHLHLVDDQAWRIEIKSYPRLTELGSRRTGMDDMLMPVSGFYTQEQMRELVAFAARYHVQVIPEIEMPGHEVAAIHCYPQLTCGGREIPLRTTCGVSDELLCPGEEFVYEFLGNVFRELADVFPSPYVHLGGDEAGNPALGCWTDCEKCRQLKRRLGILTDDRSENWRLQEYLFGRVIDTLRTRHGKVPMFWYETDFKRIPEGCVTFAWRHGLTAAAIDAAVANRAKIMLCPGEHCYLDYPMRAGDMPEVNWGMPVTSLRSTYALDPSWGRDGDFERDNLFGVAGTLWSECINSPERIYYQAYPRALALAEVGWSSRNRRSWEGFLRRLRPLLLDMQRRGVAHSRAE